MAWYVPNKKKTPKGKEDKGLDSEVNADNSQITDTLASQDASQGTLQGTSQDISDKVTEITETNSKIISEESAIVCQDELADKPKPARRRKKTRKDITGIVNTSTFVNAVVAGQTYFDGITLRGKNPNLGQYADKLKEYFLQKETNDYIFVMNSDFSNVSAKKMLFPCLAFYNTNLTNSDWTDSNIPGVHYDGDSKLEGMKMHMAWMVAGSAYKVSFKDVDLSGAIIQGTTLYECDLRDVVGLDHDGLHMIFEDDIVGKQDLGYLRGDFGRIVDATVNPKEAEILDAMNGPVKPVSKLKKTKAPEPKFTYHLAE